MNPGRLTVELDTGRKVRCQPRWNAADAQWCFTVNVPKGRHVKMIDGDDLFPGDYRIDVVTDALDSQGPVQAL